MRSSSLRAGIAFLGLVPACAAAPPVTPPAPTALVAAPPAAPAAPDLSPVDEPRALLVVARWTHPLKDVDRTLGLAGVPFTLDTLIAAQEPELAELLSPDAPVDAAVSLDPGSTDDAPKVFAAVSVPLTSFEGAVKLAEKKGRPLTQLHPGVLQLTAKHGEDMICDLAMAPGDAPARLVCGPSERDVEALRGWLVRGLTRVPPEPGNMAVTLRVKPLRDRYLPVLRTRATGLADEARTALAGQGVHDVELLAAPEIALDEGIKLLDDLDELQLRASFGFAPPQLSGSGTVRFGAQSSWLTRVLTDVNNRAGAAPAMFWRAPKEAYSATWGHGSDPRLFDGPRSVLRKAVAEVLTRAPLPPADREVIEAFVDGVPHTPGSWVTAQGFLHAAGPKRPATRTGRTPAEAIADARALAVGALGWTLMGVDAPAAEYVTWARQGLDVYTHGVRLVRDTLAAAKGAKGKEADLLGFLPRVTTKTSPPGWPRGTVAFDVVLNYDSDLAALLVDSKAKGALAHADASPPKKKAPAVKASLTVRLAIVPDGDHTWIGFSADVDGLKQRMLAAMSGAPTEGTLAAREGLEALHQSGQTWGGFFSVGEGIEALVEAVEKEKPEHGQSARAALAALPNRGRTPILLVGSGTGGRAPSSTAEVRLQKGTISDLTALVGFLASPAGIALWKKLDLGGEEPAKPKL